MSVVADRTKKKSAPSKFYKKTVQNISYFNTEKIFIIANKRYIIKNKTFHWLFHFNFLNKRCRRHKLLLF